jgi:hypothetical protein
VFSKDSLPWVESPALWMQPTPGRWKSPETLESKSPETPSSSTLDLIDKSDHCIGQVFSCESGGVTQECLKYMLLEPQYLYDLNHQVIYGLIAKKVCMKSTLIMYYILNHGLY